MLTICYFLCSYFLIDLQDSSGIWFAMDGPMIYTVMNLVFLSFLGLFGFAGALCPCDNPDLCKPISTVPDNEVCEH